MNQGFNCIEAFVARSFPDEAGAFYQSASCSASELSWVKACALANKALSENFLSTPWAGSLKAVIVDNDKQQEGRETKSRIFAGKTRLEASKLLAPQAWAPMPGSELLKKGVSRHAQIPAQSALWDEEEQRWGEWFGENAIELGIGKWQIMAFGILHEAAHCLHAQMFDGQDDWLRGYLGANKAQDSTMELIEKMIKARANKPKNPEEVAGLGEFLGNVQEGFADCWASLALKGGMPSACAYLAWNCACLREDCQNAQESHRTHLALRRLSIKLSETRGDKFNEKIDAKLAFELSLSCAIEGSILSFIERGKNGCCKALSLVKMTGLEQEDISLIERECSHQLRINKSGSLKLR